LQALAAKLAAIESSEAAAEEKEKHSNRIKAAVKWLESAAAFKSKAAQFKVAAETAPVRLTQIKQELERQLSPPVPSFKTGTPVPALEQQLSAAEAELKKAQAVLHQTQENMNSTAGAGRKAEILRQSTALAEKLKKLEADTASLAAETTAPGVRTEMRSQAEAIKAELEAVEAEKIRLEAAARLFPLERDIAQRNATWWEKMTSAWRDVVTKQRKHEAERQASEARKAVADAHPALREMAEGNARLAESRTSLTRKIGTLNGYLDAAKMQLTDIESKFEADSRKVETAGMTPAIGLHLRSRRDRMPSTREHQKRIAFAAEEMQKVQVELLELETDRANLGDIDARIKPMLQELSGVAGQLKPGQLEEMVRELFVSRKDYLDKLINDFKAYHDDLADLDVNSRKLTATIENYNSYIDTRVLWIRSGDPISLQDVDDSRKAVVVFTDLAQWKLLCTSVVNNVTSHPVAAGIGLLAVVLLLLFRGRLRYRLDTIGKTVADDQYLPTVEAIALTVVVAVLWPLIVWGAGWWISMNRGAGVLAADIGAGLKMTAYVLMAGQVIRAMLRPEGLARRHFHWEEDTITALKRPLTMAMVLGLPVVFLTTVLETHGDGVFRESLGRLAFIAGMLIFGLLTHRTFRVNRGLVPVWLNKLEVTWPYGFRHVWYTMATGTPVALAVLAALGYSYTAHQIVLYINQTFWVVVAIVLCNALISRGISVHCHRLTTGIEPDADGGPVADPVETTLEMENSVNDHVQIQPAALEEVVVETKEERKAFLVDAGAQIHKLLRVATIAACVLSAWYIWSGMFPALQVLDNVEVWATTATATETVVDADGVESAKEVTRRMPVTVADLLRCMIAATVAYVAVHRLPGLLQLTVLDRLPLDMGARHAVVIIARYALSLAGIVICGELISVSWSSVQWLLAAMTVGLGFGLQEIFANFVSGLIILFERPVRMGDLVTVGGVTGKVTRMQIRATTITDYDHRELIVPNKKFITDEVVNWTLSNPVTRFVIPVGISYSCDPTRGREVLTQLAMNHPLVLQEPAPVAVFKGFGDSTLDLELRAYIGSRDHFVAVTNELNTQIEKSFREAKLEIAFPQRDLHIRSVTTVESKTEKPVSDDAVTPKKPEPANPLKHSALDLLKVKADVKKAG